jgi:hypothetical protein
VDEVVDALLPGDQLVFLHSSRPPVDSMPGCLLRELARLFALTMRSCALLRRLSGVGRHSLGELVHFELDVLHAPESEV